MKVEYLRTVGDGFCFNHHWPMWSQLLAELLDCNWQNFALPGLGNEAMANIVIDQLASESNNNTLWVIQWAAPNRVDFRIDSAKSYFLEKIADDAIYYKNFIETAKGRHYWSSSASVLPWVVNHRELIKNEQHADRTELFKMATRYALEQAQVSWKFISTPDMMNFLPRSKYCELDVGEVQPISSVHLEYLEQFVIKDLDIDPERLEKIREKMLAVDTDRKNSGQYIPWDRNKFKRL
jgi:hypothetical protein